MVKVKESPNGQLEGNLNPDQWLEYLQEKKYLPNIELVKTAYALGQLTGYDQATETGESCFQRGLAMADVLADLEVDEETLAASITYEVVHYADLSLDSVDEQLGPNITKLVQGIERMNALSNVKALKHVNQSKHQIDNIRKMLLAMVDDVRVVLIKLAERLCVLRTSAPMPEAMRRQIAQEVMDVYAPLANRLGIGAIKWEMEDLAFRYLEPEEYKAIAKGLKSKRIERDKFVKQIVEDFNQHLTQMHYKNFEVYGRSKHIHSIHRKMLRKNIPLEEIYDATAVRVLVDTKEQCYEVLGLVHNLWKQVVIEFDDYIVNPKPNGYQSLHTAVESTEGRVFEVQIRTHEMHELAEMGVAAHWKYKEGDTQAKDSHERKIDWLRDVLAWHREMAKQQGVSEAIEAEFLEDRVYVFTPGGDVLDLPQGVTPLDFAYHVHSEVGHKCRGAKVNDHIVPLTYVLKTGDRVEVLTGKESKPSRDWINPHLNYLKTPRARAKVLHWFKMQDFDKNKIEGHELLDKELKSLGIKSDKLKDVSDTYNFKHIDDLYAAIGRGELKVGQVVNRLTPKTLTEDTKELPTLKPSHVKPTTSGSSDLKIEGVGNLLTHMARCCQPVPGDPVIGYITLGRGVSVHRQDCPNIIHATEKQKNRFLAVSWGKVTQKQYAVDLIIKAFDRSGLLRDITSLLANENAHVFALDTKTNKQENIAIMTLSVEIDGIDSLSKLLGKIGQIPNILEVRRHN